MSEEEKKTELEELYENSEWWHNRFNAVQRDYENLQQRIDKAIEYIKQDNINVEEEKWVKSEILKKYRYSVKSKLLEILGDKENE